MKKHTGHGQGARFGVNERISKEYYINKANGICTSCKKISDSGRGECKTCLIRSKKWSIDSQKYKEQSDKSLCLDCDKKRVGRRLRCSKHLQVERDRAE